MSRTILVAICKGSVYRVWHCTLGRWVPVVWASHEDDRSLVAVVGAAVHEVGNVAVHEALAVAQAYGTEHDSCRFTQNYLLYARAVEVQACSAMSRSDSPAGQKFLGRARNPRIKLEPVCLASRPVDSLRHAVGVSLLCRCRAPVSAMLSKFGTAAKSGNWTF